MVVFAVLLHDRIVPFASFLKMAVLEELFHVACGEDVGHQRLWPRPVVLYLINTPCQHKADSVSNAQISDATKFTLRVGARDARDASAAFALARCESDSHSRGLSDSTDSDVKNFDCFSGLTYDSIHRYMSAMHVHTISKHMSSLQTCLCTHQCTSVCAHVYTRTPLSH